MKKINFATIGHLTTLLLVKKTINTFLVDNKVKPLHIMLLKTSAYVKSSDGQSEWMYFLIEDDDLLEKYNTI